MTPPPCDADRAPAEEKRRKSEERFALALKAVNDGWWDWDFSENTLFLSPRWLEMLGYPPDEPPADKSSWDCLTHPDDKDRVTEAYAQALQNNLDHFEVESRRLHKNGHWVSVLTRGYISRDPSGKPVRATGTTTDLTERKRAEEAFRNAERHFRIVLDNAADIVTELDLDLNPLFISPSIEPLTGYTVDEAMALGKEGLLTPESLKNVMAIHHRELAAAKSSPPRPTRAEFDIRRKDGSIMFFENIGRYLRRPDGTPYAIVSVVRDITERRRAEERLKAYGEQMHALVARLETIRETERTRIAREVHDELGQNLTGLKMDLRWIGRALGKLKPTPEMLKLRRRVSDASELADATIATVQRLAGELRPGVLDKLGLGPALRYEARRFRENTGIDCEARAPAGSLRLSPDKNTALFRIVQECLTNVARHAQATRVTVDLCVVESDVVLRVQDNGKGIQASDLASQRSLGLLGMEERAAQFGGRVIFQRRPEGGTVVMASIPLAALEENK
jgi:PAS domain S-box-containing protein